MKKLSKILCSIVTFCSLYTTDTLSEPQTPVDCNKAEVVIIGTIHGSHYESRKYGPEVLKAIILALKPDAILNELPLSLVDPNGRPKFRDYLRSPEGWASYTAAVELGDIPQIPYDRADREENFKRTRYFERQKRANRLREKWVQEVEENDPESPDLKIAKLQRYAAQSEVHMFMNSAPGIINSEAHDSIVRINHSLWHDIIPTILKKYPGYEMLIADDHFQRDQWQERNRIMANNIIKAAKQYPKKRLVVVTGATHRYILRELLKNEPCIDLKEYWELINFDLEKCLRSIPHIPEIGILADGLTQEEASEKVAKEYWQAIIKGDWKLVNKLYPVGGVNWKDNYSKNMPVELIEVKQAFWPKQGRSSGPLAPCVVRFENGKILEIKMVPSLRKIGGKTICFITATWGKHREIKNNNAKIQEPNLLSEKVLAEKQFNMAECFDKIWEIINDKFWDPNFNGVDWEDAGKRYRPKALAAKDHESFAVIINQMLAELKTSHNHYYTIWEPNYYTLQAALISDIMAVMKTTDTSVVEKITPGKYSSRSNPHRTGIGIVTKKIDEYYYVSAVLASSPAEKAGIVVGDRLVEVNGQPFHPIRSFQNKAGQKVELTIQRGPSESTRRLVTVIPLDKKERELFEIDTQARMKTIEHKGHRFSYIRLWWLGGRVMRKALDWAINDADKVQGIIIDIRDGFGAGPADEYMGPFLKNSSETVAHEEIGRTKTFRSTVKFEKTGRFEKPVIIIINSSTRSAKEVLVYYFRKTKRGVLIGERTAGFVSGGGLERISADSLLLYCKCMKVVDGKRLEGIGVEPDIEVPFDIRFAAGMDIQLEQAKDEMVKLIEAKAAKVPLFRYSNCSFWIAFRS